MVDVLPSLLALVVDDDEFDTEVSPPSSPLGQCRAIYDYAAQQYDELTIKCGKWTKDGL